LDDGANVNWKDMSGNTALMRASQNGHVEIVRLLLEKGAQIDTQSNTGFTALMAASFASGTIECVRLLLEKGANMYIKNKHGKTVKDVAKSKGHADIIQLLDEVSFCFKLKIKVSNNISS
jgi:ankyrin repeat protein